jgi:threonine 3-dehydrogenase
MSILITGGTGFIGAEIARLLVESDEGPVYVAYRSGNFDRLEGVTDRVELVPLDLVDLEGVESTIARLAPRVIYHFGAILTGPGEQDPQGLLQVNVAGFVRLLEAARLSGTQQLIFASSIGTYGRDLDRGPITDRSLQRPLTAYGVSKVFGENLGAYYRHRYGLDFRGLRYPSIVGPGVSTWSVAQYTSWMIEKPLLGEPFEAWTKPESVIALLYYKDAARAAVELAAADRDAIRSVTYLVDGPTPTPTAAEIADAVRAAVPGAEITFDPEARQRLGLRIDDTAARAEWGWAHAYDLGAMIDDMRRELA